MFALGIFICSIYKCSQHTDVYVLKIKPQIITKSEQLCNIIVMYESYNEWHKLELASDVEFDQFIRYRSLNNIKHIFLTQNQVIKNTTYTICIFGLQSCSFDIGNFIRHP